MFHGKGPVCLWLIGGFLVFAAAAILNAGGYRYGVSDQAFYIPAALHHLDNALFPRDWALLAPQDRFSLFPAAAARAVQWTRAGLPAIFFALYLGGLLALFVGAVGIGSRLYRSAWTVVGLVFALTLRHAVALGAVNTLEGYMHPRMLAFGVGVIAVAACLAARPAASALLVALAVLCHPTTGVWFAVWMTVAFAVADRRLTRALAAAVVLACAVGAWLVVAGPLAGRLVPMDADWLSVLASKKYLFPTDWPFSGWLPAILVPAVAAWLFLERRRRGLVDRAEGGVAVGAAVLFLLFLASLPFTAARLAFAVQLQVPRVLWMVDLLAVVYLVWYLAEGAPWARRGSASISPRVAAAVLIAASLLRGGYVMLAEHRDRALVQVGLPADDWTAAMEWVRTGTPKDAWVLADPGHAWRYGTSVRVAGWRDVYLEAAKDSAVAMYSREAAMTTLRRIRTSVDFQDMTADRARALAAGGGPTLLVCERRLPLPLLYVNARFAVYRLR